MDPDDASAEDDRGAVLTPEELDITDDERVAEIDDGRFVISASGARPRVGDASDEPVSDPASTASGDDGEAASSVDEDAVRNWLRSSLDGADAHYGFDVTAKVDDRVSRHRLLSDDITVTFDTLLTWYAQRVGRGTPVEEVLGILLHESNVDVRYPPEALEALCERHGLGSGDSIADLVAAVGEEGSVTLAER